MGLGLGKLRAAPMLAWEAPSKAYSPRKETAKSNWGIT